MTQLDLEMLDDMNVGSFLDDAWHATKSVIKSNITKAVVGGVAIAFPPVGVPAAAALIVADRVVRASESKDAKIAAKAKAVIANTISAAEKGDTHAAAAAKVLTIAKAHAPSPAAISSVAAAAASAAAAQHAAQAGPAAASAAASAAAAKAAEAARDAAARKATPPSILSPATPAGWIRAQEGAYKRAS